MNSRDKRSENDSSVRRAFFGKSKLTVITAVLFVLGLILLIARTIPGFGTFYSETLYPIWQGSLGRLAGVFPFSLSELILYLLPIILFVDIIVNRKIVSRVLGHICFFLALLFFLYFANCGVNYSRTSFMETEAITSIEEIYDEGYIDGDTDGTPNILIDFCKFAVQGINQNQETYPTGRELQEKAREAMIDLASTYPSLSGYYPVPKPILNSRPFTNMEVTGIYSPFTIEANYNREIPGYDLPFTVCHELSHLRGFMDEGEANFIGWLACLNSADEGFRRSAYMMAWVYGGNELLKTNPAIHRELRSEIPEAALEEFQVAREFWNKNRTSASEVQDKINDAYLKSNGLKEGIKSYDKVLIMMLSWYSGN